LEDNNVQAGMLSILYAIAFSTGPVIGGALISVASWRWIFGINLPACALSMVMIFLFLRTGTKGPQPPRRLSYLPTELSEELRAKTKENGSSISNFLRIDTIGACLFIACGILILLGLSWGSTGRWDQARVIVSFVVGGVLLLLFIGWEWMLEHSTDHLVREFEERRRDHEAGDSSAPQPGLRQGMARFAPKWAYTTDAMIPMNMFRSFDVVATNFAAMVSGMIMLGIFYFVSVQYVIVQGKSATSSGVGLLYFAPGMVRTLFVSCVSPGLTIWLRAPGCSSPYGCSTGSANPSTPSFLARLSSQLRSVSSPKRLSVPIKLKYPDLWRCAEPV
jgi:MFS family permease